MPVIRPAKVDDAPGIARVQIDTWRTTYKGIVPDEHLANLNYEHCQAKWIEHLSNPQDKTHVFVAEIQSGEIVGFASCRPLREPVESFDGELYILYILKSFQVMGLGRALLKKIAHDLANRNCHSMVLWVLKENPACRFYERLGGRFIAEKWIEIGRKQLLDVAYVWPDLTVFKEN